MKFQVMILSTALFGICYSLPQRSQLYQTPEIRVPAQLYGTPIVETTSRPIIRTSTSPSTTTKSRPDEDTDPSENNPSIIVLPEDQTESPPMMGMPYSFKWDVEDNPSSNLFSHVESSDGQRMEGEYKVMLPDGRMQIVKYFDDGNGLNAEVNYLR